MIIYSNDFILITSLFLHLILVPFSTVPVVNRYCCHLFHITQFILILNEICFRMEDINLSLWLCKCQQNETGTAQRMLSMNPSSVRHQISQRKKRSVVSCVDNQHLTPSPTCCLSLNYRLPRAPSRQLSSQIIAVSTDIIHVDLLFGRRCVFFMHTATVSDPWQSGGFFLLRSKNN